MRFQSLARQLKNLDPKIWVLNNQRLRITGVVDDSREVMPGNLFAALPGTKHDGTGFVRDALNLGASALLVGRPMRELKLVPQIVTDDPRRTLGHLASLLYGEPSRHMKVIGITGTNGKTTSAFVLREIFERCGLRTGLMGTVWNIVGSEKRAARLTTPGSLQVHKMLAEMRAHGQEACIMEVSSHALHQHRVTGVRFTGAIFTNLTRDHLDYHGDFDEYFNAKAMLFEMLDPACSAAVVNLDDEFGPRMRDRASSVAFGFSESGKGDVDIEQIKLGVNGMSFGMRWINRASLFHSPMTGRYNVQNLVGAITMALALDLPLPKIRATVMQFKGAPGRLERVPFDQPAPAVFVDYAHTPDAMENVLSTLRQVCPDSRLTCVFGCGGDRDRTKRPKMGAIGAQYADRPIVTSDNPRGEKPESIIEEVLAGFPPRKRPAEVYIDRREAIRNAIAQAGPEDVVVIVGKGHEDYQIFSDRTVHFDDKEEARLALEHYWGVAGSGRRAVARV
ncbi:MAG: UDP-N-acetylmuramoyl-L-alanyl-D-glutamate--2,6-diaminopimelate ligase [Planctomycetes bacterium]|nr:UDP-N-acetylmuramoyl-L-alanyl-D-glutamate--2,6-diaminopimelate ligase [Planctomycetota bacterium]